MMKNLLGLCLVTCIPLLAQEFPPPIPAPTDLPGSPFFIKKTWVIGGAGNWDYLTVDPAAHLLFIAHSSVVQVVDTSTGALAGQITGLREAHDIALDDTGDFGFISDGFADQVKVFNRRTLLVVASIPTGPNPRALVFDAHNKLLFAVCANPVSGTSAQTSASQAEKPAVSRQSGASQPAAGQPSADQEIKTSITVIDVKTRQRLGDVLMSGTLGLAQTDGNGRVYVNIVDRDQIARLDARSLGALLSEHLVTAASLEAAAGQTAAAPEAAAASTQTDASQPGPASSGSTPSSPPSLASDSRTWPVLDWSHESHPAQSQSGSDRLHLFALGPDCHEPRGLAADGRHLRLFVACGNMKMTVLNADTGEVLTSLPTGPGSEVIGYDPNRGLIYSANAGGNGTLTIIRQDVADSYAVIQNLPTSTRARTLAVNPANGEVYMVADILGVDLAKPATIGTLQLVPVEGSFQVLAIGN
jgi:DNA-binding beta-propeller fold protein YncE